MDAYFLPWHEGTCIDIQRILIHFPLLVKQDKVDFPWIDGTGETHIPDSRRAAVYTVLDAPFGRNKLKTISEMIAEILIRARDWILLEIFLITGQPLGLEEPGGERSDLPGVYCTIYRSEVQFAV